MSSLEILYHQHDLIAVNKPSGMLVHPGWGKDEVVAMKVVRDMVGQWVYPIHRLDRGTSGVLLFALSSETASQINGLFARRQVHKSYLALVRGVPEAEGTIDYALPNKEDGPRVDAQTSFRRLGVFERFGLMEAMPRTGRPHQIRRHFKHISHPLVGDVRYGKGEINRLFRERFGLHRLALHARHLRFEHPVAREAISIWAPVPQDLNDPLRAMGLEAAVVAPQS